jgi:hypothetical protein
VPDKEITKTKPIENDTRWIVFIIGISTNI